jgi:hypothetical protein
MRLLILLVAITSMPGIDIVRLDHDGKVVEPGFPGQHDTALIIDSIKTGLSA